MPNRRCRIAYRDAGAAPDWGNFPAASIDTCLWEENGYRPAAFAKACSSRGSMDILLCAAEKKPLATYTSKNSPVYRDSRLEFFIQPLPEKDGRYLNFEFNPLGTLLLGVGSGRNDRTPLGTDVQKMLGIRAFSGEERGRPAWGVEFSIPLSLLNMLFPGVMLVSGAKMRGNSYKCGDNTQYPHYGCWSPIVSEKPNFHLPEFFGELYLG